MEYLTVAEAARCREVAEKTIRPGLSQADFLSTTSALPYQYPNQPL